jgi:hypothetical protein
MTLAAMEQSAKSFQLTSESGSAERAERGYGMLTPIISSVDDCSVCCRRLQLVLLLSQ